MRRTWRNFWSRRAEPRPASRVVPRADLVQQLETELARPGSSRPPLSLLQLSLDSHASVLHRNGLDAAVALLDSVEDILIQHVPAGGCVARLRPPEFLLLAPATGAEAIDASWERIRRALRDEVGGDSSAGLVTSLDHTLAMPQLLQQAYQCLYEAQRDPANPVRHVVIERAEAAPYRRGRPPPAAPEYEAPLALAESIPDGLPVPRRVG